MAKTTVVAPDPTAIGDVSSPPFAQLPDPVSLFSNRAARLRLLAQTSPLKPYLSFIVGLTEAQIKAQASLAAPPSPDDEAVHRAQAFAMPLVDRRQAAESAMLKEIFDHLFDAVEPLEKPAPAAQALANVVRAGDDERCAMTNAVFSGLLPADAIAEHIYTWAGLQVHLARLASALDLASVKPVADGVCPVCGSLPVSTMVVGWPGSHGARFCACSLCGTLWHYVRIKCVLCGSTKGIGYQEVEGGNGVIKAETCDECKGWVKILYQQKGPGADPVADDVANLGLDMLMREGPYRRGGFSPLLAGL
ncbi:MAG: formate dehydrogenase accessory protein FdhE [Phyllobacterium sp.]